MSRPADLQAMTTAAPTVWLTGLPSAGKTTLARDLVEILGARGLRARLLDGDELRAAAPDGQDFSRAGRRRQAHTVAALCATLRTQASIPVVALVSPYRSDRLAARTLLSPGFVEVFVDAPLAVCERRDVKGLYARARAGSISHMTGLDDPYEAPERPEVRVRTDREDPAASVQQILDVLARGGI